MVQVDNSATSCSVSKFKSSVMAMKAAMKAKAMKAMKKKAAAAPDAAPKKAMEAIKAVLHTLIDGFEGHRSI